ncbi:MAG TPA: TetR/AcrR family transcriptional regulator [Pseudolysinimonas sp.]|nr:TetR/AcrR family transcriptional regulator [Pseudolysinimonas sp.]
MTEQRRGGRARSEESRNAILDATALLFAQRGYDHLTIEGIAAAAGVGKQTIYRWWRSRGELVADCLLDGRLLPGRFLPPDTGDLRADLAAWLADVLTLLDRTDGEQLMRSLIQAAAENEEVGRRLRERLSADASVTERIQAGIDAGQLRSGAPVAEIADALVGAIILRALSRSGAEASPARLVDAVLG